MGLRELPYIDFIGEENIAKETMEKIFKWTGGEDVILDNGKTVRGLAIQDDRIPRYAEVFFMILPFKAGVTSFARLFLGNIKVEVLFLQQGGWTTVNGIIPEGEDSPHPMIVSFDGENLAVEYSETFSKDDLQSRKEAFVARKRAEAEARRAEAEARRAEADAKAKANAEARAKAETEAKLAGRKVVTPIVNVPVVKMAKVPNATEKTANAVSETTGQALLRSDASELAEAAIKDI